MRECVCVCVCVCVRARVLNNLLCEKKLSWHILMLAEHVSGGTEYNILDSGKIIALETDSFFELCS